MNDDAKNLTDDTDGLVSIVSVPGEYIRCYYEDDHPTSGLLEDE